MKEFQAVEFPKMVAQRRAKQVAKIVDSLFTITNKNITFTILLGS